MECICGYRYNEPDRDSEEFKLVSDGDDQFIEIDGYFRAHINYESRQVRLLSCPKCNTVQLSRW